MFHQIQFIIFYYIVCNCYSSNSVVFNECGKTISRYQFILQSPGYPNSHPASLNCEYSLEGHHSCPTEFHFQLVDFNLPFSQRNCTNRLEIIGHESLCGILTGVRMYKIQSGKKLHLRFTANTINQPNSRGFKIVITRIPCANGQLTSNNLLDCCASTYNTRRFYLASPDFPNTNNNDCVYKVYRANPNICRLRIHATYFSANNGSYLEIDGKKITGCQTGLDVISQFDQFWGNKPKIIRYKNSVKQQQQHYNGFVIEVIQDECPTRYSPSFINDTYKNNTNNNNNNKVPQFYYYNDQLNRIRFADETTSHLIDYYFFRAPPDDNYNQEERNYFDTTDSILPNNNNNIEKCVNWGVNQYQLLTKEILWKKMPQCSTQQLNPNCYDVKLINGYLTSPGYSQYYYPPNINNCYRFHKLNGFCGIQFSVLDFDLEASFNCDKDAFILYDKYKYCGSFLHNKYFKFDLLNRNYEDIKFQTDNYYCNKGFKIYFEHTPCPQVSAQYCNKRIKTEIFDVTISNANKDCVYVIEKIDKQNTCGVQLLFIELNLSCEYEYLMINEEKICGRMSDVATATKWVTFDPDDLVTIAYRSRLNYRPVLTSIVLRGQQIAEHCDPFMLDVPAQRQLHN